MKIKQNAKEKIQKAKISDEDLLRNYITDFAIYIGMTISPEKYNTAWTKLCNKISKLSIFNSPHKLQFTIDINSKPALKTLKSLQIELRKVEMQMAKITKAKNNLEIK